MNPGPIDTVPESAVSGDERAEIARRTRLVREAKLRAGKGGLSARELDAVLPPTEAERRSEELRRERRRKEASCRHPD